MASRYTLHPETPQQRTVNTICQALRQGAVMLYPTDTVYAIGCDVNDKGAVQRVRQLKQLSNNKPLTFLCSSLSNIAEYAKVSDEAYRLMRHLIPGPYTFLLPASKQVPKMVINPKRKTTGIRVPDQAICQSFLSTLGNPIVSTSAHLPDDDEWEVMEKAVLFDRLEGSVDLIIDSDRDPGYQTSSIIDCTGKTAEVVREGLGWEKLSKLVVGV